MQFISDYFLRLFLFFPFGIFVRDRKKSKQEEQKEMEEYILQHSIDSIVWLQRKNWSIFEIRLINDQAHEMTKIRLMIKFMKWLKLD